MVISHLITKHEKRYFCDLYAKYFGTKHTMETQIKTTHNENENLSEDEVITQLNSDVVKQEHKENRHTSKKKYDKK